MPFTEKARAEMMRIFTWTGLTLRIGPNETETLPGEQAVTFAGGDVVSNTAEIVFDRAAGEQTAAFWFVYREDELLSVGKLQRPIMLRAGERATFEAGALKLELT